MTQPNEPIVRHSDREIAHILQRAAVLQQQDRERGAGASGTVSGLSLEELRRVAAEVGIAPHYIDAAAAELRGGDPSHRRFFLWGAPDTTEVEHVVDGDVPEEEWEALVAAIRRSEGQVGETHTLGQTLEWSASRDHVSISPRGGQTRIRILAQHFERILPIHVPAGALSLILIIVISTALHSSPLEVLALCAASAGTMFGLSRALVGSLVNRKTRQMKALLRELADQVAQSAPRGSQATELSTPLIGTQDPARLTAPGDLQTGLPPQKDQPAASEVQLDILSTRSNSAQ
jgi:hypothetical protein